MLQIILDPSLPLLLKSIKQKLKVQFSIQPFFGRSLEHKVLLKRLILSQELFLICLLLLAYQFLPHPLERAPHAHPTSPSSRPTPSFPSGHLLEIYIAEENSKEIKKNLMKNLPSYFPEDCIMSFFVVCGVVISSSASWRNPFLSVLPWGFPQELAVKFLGI